MKAMTCTTCHKVVYVNNTGICLGCQMRSSELMGDEWKPEQPANKVMSQEEMLTERVKELEEELTNTEFFGTKAEIKNGLCRFEDGSTYDLKQPIEVKDAIQESETKSVDVCEQASDGQGVAKRNSKRKKASPKGKEEKVKFPPNWGKVDGQVF